MAGRSNLDWGASMIQIGRFELDPELRTLNGRSGRVRIGARAFDILMYLATSRGRLVTKDELIRHVWPDTIVEENNLQVHLSALRKALGADRNLIVTLTGRGYQLAGHFTRAQETTAAQTAGMRVCQGASSGICPHRWVNCTAART
jgi:DNA-binding winged helix-turn-helix (wHTH) protein